LTGILKLLHPFMPFITEEIYQSLPHDENEESIMIARYPAFDESLLFSEDTERMNVIIDAIRAIRNRRSEMNIVPSRRAKVYIATAHPEYFPESSAVFFQRLASASEVEVAGSFEGKLSADETVQIVTAAATILLPLSDIIDVEKEKARLSAEQKKLEGEIARLSAKLSNEGFVAKAPAAVVEGERAKLEKYRENLAGVISALEKLN
jgi:valyl-tRNA synthetase